MDKTSNRNAKKKASSRNRKNPERAFETMSQQQNRYGKGRERNGSDGGSVVGRGMNH